MKFPFEQESCLVKEFILYPVGQLPAWLSGAGENRSAGNSGLLPLSAIQFLLPRGASKDIRESGQALLQMADYATIGLVQRLAGFEFTVCVLP